MAIQPLLPAKKSHRQKAKELREVSEFFRSFLENSFEDQTAIVVEANFEVCAYRTENL
jgi:hypothetical protein